MRRHLHPTPLLGINLNINLHLLALDGAYAFETGRPRFHRARSPSGDEPERLLDTLILRAVRTATRAGAPVPGLRGGGRPVLPGSRAA